MDKKIPFSNLPDCTVVIVAAGKGTRFGGETPKQFVSIHGKALLRHTIERFVKLPCVKSIQVVIHPDYLNEYEIAVQGLSKILPVVYGGNTRQESVRNALNSLTLDDNSLVLVHDAARPLFSEISLFNLLESLTKCQAATLALPVHETLRKGHDNKLGEIVSRDGLYSIQTPQGFHFGILKAAHNKQKNIEFTDDTSLVSSLDIAVEIVMGNRDNIKITTPEDIMFAERLMPHPSPITVTGIGFDVHAFGDVSTHIRIGGIDIPYTHKLKGHSDADVLLHAITDALYGTIADGDIGSHFPPSDDTYKGQDSSYFLIKALEAVQKNGGKLVHIDSVIMCEAPKIGPYREAIQHRLSALTGLKISRIGVKATTTEELGFTGRREGIAAQAIVSVQFSDQDEE
jgi:2-C-methyl-D-erythritol 4-phosphate cytidylyltransferase/2-C-methyl-D-erythritol 2,4-cyclodiphosphate synthase